MMKMLKEYYDVEMQKIDKEIQELCLKMKKFKSHKLYASRQNQLSTVLEQHNKDVIRKKN